MNTINSPLLGLSQRLPPSNLQAEQALLGALLANNKAYERVSEFLVPEHFADPLHGRIFQAIARRIEAGQLADAVTLKAEFEHSGVLEEVGGTAYLAQLLTAMVGIINAGEYGRAIYDAWLRRQLIDIGETVVNHAFGADPELDGTKQIEAAEQQLFDLATDGGTSGGFVTFERALTEAIQGAERAFRRSGSVSGLSTGLRDLDAKMGGLHPSDLLILAGRPGMGKTALATKIAFGAARALMRGGAANRSGRVAEGQRGDLLAGNERRAARDPPSFGGGAHLRRPHPARRHRPARLRPFRARSVARSPACRIQIDDTPGDHALGHADALPATEAHQRAEPRGGGLSAAHAALRPARSRRTGCWRSARSRRG